MQPPRGVAVLGSTGSIGRQTLEVLAWHPRRFRAAVLAAGSDSDAFRAQVLAVRPRLAVVGRARDRAWLPPDTELAVGHGALIEAVERPDVELVVVATSGVVSLRPTLAALRARKTVAVANKEVLVTAGHLVMATARQHAAEIRPIDSEHSAIWQCLRGEAVDRPRNTVRRIILTASGGPFRDWPAERLRGVTPADALRHPNWSMGPKITVDSATMMNKGLEAIEARWLFEQPLDAIDIVVHRESIVHSLVEFFDRSVKAQLAAADMRLPIQYALAYPDRLPAPTEPLDLTAIGRLTFESVDTERFPCPGLAFRAGRLGQTYPAVLNAANEEAVRLFLAKELSFDRLPGALDDALEAHVPIREPDLRAIQEADAWARRHVREKVLRGRAGGIMSRSLPV
jgi:1-deoxy-D-xylulose-5-phosphate reductoisomerase